MKQPRVLRGLVGDVTFALLLLSIFCANASFVRVAMTNTSDLLFLIWNLALAWVPLIFAWLLFTRTRRYGLQWGKLNALYFAIWILFLPNAFYLVTDFVHLAGDFSEPQRIYDIVLLMSYSVLGILLGVIALMLVHIRAVQRFKAYGHILPVIALLVTGFGIYLGRYLQWNSWDIVLNPFGILFDVSDRIVNPTSHLQTFGITFLFFVFYGLVYLTAWRIYRLLQYKTD
jgi:uncharacterized membrane protein